MIQDYYYKQFIKLKRDKMKRPDKNNYYFNSVFDGAKFAHDMIKYTDHLESQLKQPSDEEVREKVVELIDDIDYNQHAEGCGLEDRGITDRYDAMDYGWSRAIKSVVEQIDSSLTLGEDKECEELKEASEIIQHLKSYGMIHTVEGVIYPEGSHEDFIKRADKWLNNK